MILKNLYFYFKNLIFNLFWKAAHSEFKKFDCFKKRRQDGPNQISYNRHCFLTGILCFFIFLIL